MVSGWNSRPSSPPSAAWRPARAALDHGAVVVGATAHRARAHAAHRHVDIVRAIQPHAGQALEAQRLPRWRARTVAGAGRRRARPARPPGLRCCPPPETTAGSGSGRCRRSAGGHPRPRRCPPAGCRLAGTCAVRLPSASKRTTCRPCVPAVRRITHRLPAPSGAILPGCSTSQAPSRRMVRVSKRSMRLRSGVAAYSTLFCTASAAHGGVLALAHGGDAQEAVQHRLGFTSSALPTPPSNGAPRDRWLSSRRIRPNQIVLFSG